MKKGWVDDVVAVAVDDAAAVGLAGAGLLGGDEGRADVGEVGAHGLRGQDRAPEAMEPDSASGPSDHWRISWIARTGSAAAYACAIYHRDQAVGALLDGLVREGVVDDVVQDHAAARCG